LSVSHINKEETEKESNKCAYRGITRKSFSHAWRINDKFDLSKTQAELDKGLLKITVPLAPEKKPKEIEVNPVLSLLNGIAPGFIRPFIVPSNINEAYSELSTFILAIFIRPTGKSIVSELMNMFGGVEGPDITIGIGLLIGIIILTILNQYKIKLPKANKSHNNILSYMNIAFIIGSFIVTSTLGVGTIPVLLTCIGIGYLIAISGTKCFLSMIVVISTLGFGN
jgi:hypothetical protein